MDSVPTTLQSLFSFYILAIRLLCVLGLLGILKSTIDGEISKERRGRGLLAEVQMRGQLPQKCPDSGLQSPPVSTVSECSGTPWGLEGQVTLGLLSEHRPEKAFGCTSIHCESDRAGTLSHSPRQKNSAKVEASQMFCMVSVYL